jgi:EAL domain-containing protein (putative c-di-GMP-specific phosphodiesterase class I)
MTTDRESHEIVRLIATLADSVGLTIVAEGTETEEQIAELKRLDCEMAQGFLFSPPVSAKVEFRLLVKSHQAGRLVN